MGTGFDSLWVVAERGASQVTHFPDQEVGDGCVEDEAEVDEEHSDVAPSMFQMAPHGMKHDDYCVLGQHICSIGKQAGV